MVTVRQFTVSAGQFAFVCALDECHSITQREDSVIKTIIMLRILNWVIRILYEKIKNYYHIHIDNVLISSQGGFISWQCCLRAGSPRHSPGASTRPLKVRTNVLGVGGCNNLWNRKNLLIHANEARLWSLCCNNIVVNRNISITII